MRTSHGRLHRFSTGNDSSIGRRSSKDMMVMSEEHSEPVQSSLGGGYAIYRKSVLRHYDWIVHGFSNPLVWRVPTRKIHQMYRQNLSNWHLEVGVGTGKFLLRHWPQQSGARLVIADASRDCLEWTSERLKRRRISLDSRVQIDFESEQSSEVILGSKFLSIGLNYVLHCLPGTATRQRALKFIRSHLAPDGVLFGSTLMGAPVSHYTPARWLEKKYQKTGIFSNRSDSIDSISDLLAGHFHEVACRPCGRAIFFHASQPRV